MVGNPSSIPLVFPVFGKGKAPHVTAALPQHGFARISQWKLIESTEVPDAIAAQFGLDHTLISEEYRQLWPYEFSLTYTVKLTADRLETYLRVHNVGDQAFDFNTLLHTYFLIPDASKVRVVGLSGHDYVDKVHQQTPKQQGDVIIPGEVDSVYASVSSPSLDIRFGQEEAAGGVRLERRGVEDIVVWNPWVEKAAGMADFGNEEYHRMICVEAGQVAEFIALAAGGSWEGGQVLSLL
ncbi:hypothetical protein BGW38_006411 [Lunasporangiospora selenospora]|uniref:glucose-6-phosphate 1-epimerase n=1 Tax=Lunasporangiospora selenospora TaxID=979761 RepID=A0A9P6KAS6_9FUNG|nr:hypothetical protein BGW38_006411 [Lunasporangiospora selenospora]